MKKNRLAALLAAVVALSGCGVAPEGGQEAPSDSTVATTDEVKDPPEEGRADDSSKGSSTEEDDEGLFDTTPISDAYLMGDVSQLGELQLEIYGLATAVLEDIITDGMTDYEKELAVHDYLISHVEYDMDNISIFETHGEHASDPYGALAEGKCICSGYTTTFQMFMDMLEIPCRSIQAVDKDGDDHAWNMVMLNGHWYYVDVTWDDPVPDVENRPVTHKYFNISEKRMAERHVWDSSNEPETDSEEDSFIAHSLRTVNSVEEIRALMEQTLASGTMDMYFEPADSTGWQLGKAEKNSDSYVGADRINEELGQLHYSFEKDHPDYRLRWQRISFDGRIIVGVYMYKY